MEDSVWERHEERQRRQEEFRRIDEWLQKLQIEHPFLALALTAAISMAIFVIAMGIKAAIQWIGEP